MTDRRWWARILSGRRGSRWLAGFWTWVSRHYDATRLFDYGHSGRDQVAWVVDRLCRDPASRSAAITTFQPHTDSSGTWPGNSRSRRGDW